MATNAISVVPLDLPGTTSELIASSQGLSNSEMTQLFPIHRTRILYISVVDYFHDAVFNYPTLAEAYKVAALDGLNKL
jgi:hypothetical protein